MKTKRISLFLSLLSVVALDCANLSGGNGSETTNGRVVGRLVFDDGAPAAQTRVKLVSSGYDPVKDGLVPDSLTGTTDSLGNYAFLRVPDGDYAVLAINGNDQKSVIITGIHVHGRSDTVAQDTLRPPGFLKVMLPSAVNTTTGYVYIPGTTFFALLKNSSGFVVLDSVPVVRIADIAYSAIAALGAIVIRYGIRVTSGDTAVVWNPQWNRARKCVLNTSSTGADVTGDVVNFPVFIRLTPANFDFSQAKAGGADIRFTKSDTSFIPCKIERWDPIAGHAEVWVKADTVHGSDSTQSLMMYWGNPSAAESSNAAAVFDSASGFQGVWHLNETSGTRAADASPNGFSGTYRGGLPKNEQSPLGNCQLIARPDSEYVDMGDVLNPGLRNISLGVWIKRGSFVTPQGLIAKTNGDLPSAAYGYLLSIDPANTLHFNMASGGAQWGDDGTFEVAGNLAITDSTTWHYVFVAIDRSDNALCKMYIDGIDRTSIRGGNIARVSSVANALSLHIGTESDRNCSFTGAIGEATIAFTARSADWVKLSFMNQKGKDALVTW